MLKCYKKKCAGNKILFILMGMVGGVAICCLWHKKLGALFSCRKKCDRGGDADGCIDTPDLEFDYDFDDGASAYGDRCGYETARNLTPPEDEDK